MEDNYCLSVDVDQTKWMSLICWSEHEYRIFEYVCKCIHFQQVFGCMFKFIWRYCTTYMYANTPATHGRWGRYYNKLTRLTQILHIHIETCRNVQCIQFALGSLRVLNMYYELWMRPRLYWVFEWKSFPWGILYSVIIQIQSNTMYILSMWFWYKFISMWFMWGYQS